MFLPQYHTNLCISYISKGYRVSVRIFVKGGGGGKRDNYRVKRGQGLY